MGLFDNKSTPEEISESRKKAAVALAKIKQDSVDAFKKSASEVYAGQKLTKEEQAEMMAALDARLFQIYDERGAVTNTDVENAMKSVVDDVLGKTVSATEIKARNDIKEGLVGVDGIAGKVFKSKTSLVADVNRLLDLTQKPAPDFKYVKEVKKLQVMSNLQNAIGPVLNAEYKGNADEIAKQKQAALEATIKKILKAGTGGELSTDDPARPGEVEKVAKKMATDIIDTDTTMRTELTTFIDTQIIAPEAAKKKEAITKTETDATDALAADLAGKAADKLIPSAAAPLGGGGGVFDEKNKQAMVNTIKADIAAAVKVERATKDSIKADIIASADKAAKAAGVTTLPDDFNKIAEEMAAQALAAKGAIEAKTKADLKALEDAKNLTRKNIIAGVTDRVWPALMRQEVTADQRANLVKEAVADSVRGNGTLTADQQKKIDDFGGKLDGYLRNPVNTFKPGEANDFVVSTVRSAANGGSFMGGLSEIVGKAGTGTALGGGAGAVAALTLNKQLGWFGSTLVAAGLTSAGLAYDNGLFNGKPGNTPGPKPDDKGAPAAAK